MPHLVGNNFAKALKDFKSGKIIIIADDENRESEGDFVCAASLCKQEHINFMVTNGKGLVCAAITEERAEQLNLPRMPQRNVSRFETAFTVSVEAKHGTTTGISAAERALTCRTLADASKNANDFICPGHIFPLVAKKGGVLERDGHTEAAVELCRMASLPQAAVICEVLNPDGTMARMPQLKKVAKKHNLAFITVQDIIDYRLANEILVERVAEPVVPTRHGNFKAIAYKNKINGEEYVAFANPARGSANVRIHSECLTGDVFHSLKCDCGEQLDFSMKYIAKHGGVLVYMLGHEGRGIGLANKLKAYELQERGLDTIDSNLKLGFGVDQRNYAFAAQILKDLGIKSINLLTNNPQKISELEFYGIKVSKRIPIEIKPNPFNKKYLKTKKEKMGHLLSMGNNV
ncbi:MAG: 3,4-dihydroxy-2-butanone-4-phosphate synthase [Fibromonadaceae bacterium]|jgi:3,4-dihydroxy 2-butanone 4-phosphate synthase/GTP cyclohydrolase II|nr:3,4-dihydroxy-2-butanone-4-phosphate synthase [Fibromonadaceae bacterium]